MEYYKELPNLKINYSEVSNYINLYDNSSPEHYYGYAMTLEEIGETFDLTRERVRQIKEKAIKRLKHNSRSKILKSYLGK